MQKVSAVMTSQKRHRLRGNTVDAIDLVKLTEIFLVPSSILVGALSVATTEPLKTGISILGLLVAGLWGVCNYDAVQQLIVAMPLRAHVLAWLPVAVGLCWLFCAIVHAYWWRYPTDSPVLLLR